VLERVQWTSSGDHKAYRAGTRCYRKEQAGYQRSRSTYYDSKIKGVIQTLTQSNVLASGRRSLSRRSTLHAKILLGGMLIGLTGCAGQKVTRTGFLPDYNQMKFTPAHQHDLIYVSPVLKASNYKAVIIDPVVWDSGAKGYQPSPAVAARMEAAFHQSLTKQLSLHYQIIAGDNCGTCAGVLRVRAAITNIRRSRWYFNLAPMAVQLATGSLVPLPPVAPGGASEELEAVDAATGQTMVAIATYNNGKPWQPVGAFVPYRHAEQSFTMAAKLLDGQMQHGNS
jgi:hypothetical protein